MKPELNIGEVAAQAGVNRQTLRYYERRGILAEPERTAAGYRKYPSETVRVIRFIKRAQDLGFTLTEVEDLLTIRDTRSRTRARALASAKLESIDSKVRDLLRMKAALETLVTTCACSGSASHCPILEAFDGSHVAEVQNG